MSFRGAGVVPRAGARWLAGLAILALLAALAGSALRAPLARADGDPASDVLVSQTLFLPADAGASSAEAASLRGLLRASGRAGFPIRVAVIASGYDLGSVTALWRRPRTYARFLGIELSLVHRQPLLVVMPDGFGFDWAGHPLAAAYRALSRIPIGVGNAGLLAAAGTAVRTLAASHGSRLAAASAGNTTPPSRGGDGVVTIVAVLAAGLAVLAVLGFGVVVKSGAPRRGRRRERRRGAGRPARSEPAVDGRGGVLHGVRRGVLRGRLGGRRWAVPAMAAVCGVAAGTPILVVSLLRHPSVAFGSHVSAVATPYTWGAGQRRAPGIRLTGENGGPISLAAYRGRPVIVTFVDPLCRDLCPLAAHVINQVDRDLPSAQRPEIIAVSVDVYADTHADLSEDFRRWDLVPQWHWAIGSSRQLRAVWARYHVNVSVDTKTIAGTTVHFVTHDEEAFVVDRSGHLRALYGWPYLAGNVEAELRRLA